VVTFGVLVPAVVVILRVDVDKCDAVVVDTFGVFVAELMIFPACPINVVVVLAEAVHAFGMLDWLVVVMLTVEAGTFDVVVVEPFHTIGVLVGETVATMQVEARPLDIVVDTTVDVLVLVARGVLVELEDAEPGRH